MTVFFLDPHRDVEHLDNFLHKPGIGNCPLFFLIFKVGKFCGSFEYEFDIFLSILYTGNFKWVSNKTILSHTNYESAFTEYIFYVIKFLSLSWTGTKLENSK